MIPAAKGPCACEHLQGHLFCVVISVWRCLNWSYLTPGYLCVCVWQWCIPSNVRMMISHWILGVPFRQSHIDILELMNCQMATLFIPKDLGNSCRAWKHGSKEMRCLKAAVCVERGSQLWLCSIFVCGWSMRFWHFNPGIPLKTWSSHFLPHMFNSVLHFWNSKSWNIWWLNHHYLLSVKSCWIVVTQKKRWLLLSTNI